MIKLGLHYFSINFVQAGIPPSSKNKLEHNISWGVFHISSDLIADARNKAGDNFRQGYNCSESIFLAFRDLVAPELDPGLVKMFTGFGGGLGHAGCICGALSSAEMIIGLFTGRTSNEEDREVAYQAAREFYNLFEERFKGTCCRALNPHPFDTPEHLKNCIKITGNTGKLLMEYLIGKGLVPQNLEDNG